MALSEQGLIQQAISEFRRRFHSHVPGEPRHFSEFCEESEIRGVAKAERNVVVEEFMKKVLTLASLDLTRIGDLCKELCDQLQAVIDECIENNEELKIEAEAFLQKQIDYLCEVLQTSLEAKLILNPEMDMETLRKHLEHGKTSTTAHFEIWKHGNVEFYEMQKRKLKENLEKLEQEFIEEQKRHLSVMSTPEVEVVSQEGVPSVQIARNIFENEDDSSDLEFETSSSSQSQATLSLVTDDETPFPKRQKLQPEASSAPDGWNPLIFRLTADHIAMGTRIGNEFVKQFRSKYGEPPVVGLLENGSLLSGSAAFICREHWSLEEFLGDSSPGKKITFRTPGGDPVSQELNAEFLLGFILKSMKTYAESQVKKNFDCAIISIPLWFPSLHRTQIKNAANISGFSTVHLVNHESVAVYAHVLKRHRSQPLELMEEEDEGDMKSDVLVLSESFGVVSAVLYECHWNPNSHAINVIMIRDQYSYSAIGKNEDLPTRKRKVKEVCVNINLLRGNGKVIFLTESLEWMKTFEEVAGELRYNFDDDGHVSVLPSEMFGASIFCEKMIEEIQASVHECLPGKLEPTLKLEGSSSKIIKVKVIQHKILLPKEFEMELAMEYFQNRNQNERRTMVAKVSQENLKRGENVSLGMLVFKGERDPKILGKYSVSLKFEIDVEGIVSMEGIRLNKLGKCWGSLSREDFGWVDPGLSGAEIEAIKKLIHSIVTISLEKPATKKK